MLQVSNGPRRLITCASTDVTDPAKKATAERTNNFRKLNIIGSRRASAQHERRLWLPDPADIHVLAVAVSASADAILTLNAKDFPRRTLAEEGVQRLDPDSFLMQAWQANPDAIAAQANRVLAEANRLSGQGWQMRALLKKARLPRLAKALGA